MASFHGNIFLFFFLRFFLDAGRVENWKMDENGALGGYFGCSTRDDM